MEVSASDSKIEKCDIKQYDIFITPSSETRDEIGFAAVADEDILDAVYSYHVMRYRLYQKNSVTPYFIRYLFEVENLRNQIFKASKGLTRFGLSAKDFAKLRIPYPAVDIQEEIVKTLDLFTSLEAELEAELEARKTQYTYYRDSLLRFDDKELEWKTLEEIYEFKYGTGNTIPTVGGEYPVYGSNGIVGTHNECNSEDSPVIGHIGAYAGIVNWAPGKHFVTYNGVICRLKNTSVHPRYAFHQLLVQDFRSKANSGSQPFVSYSMLNKVEIPVPSLTEQERIAEVLDKFDALVNDISVGLPAEIEARRKQYEYYRNRLLRFKNITD
jgi:type I restriction enzyme S subunit